jgi:hypothetical protein
MKTDRAQILEIPMGDKKIRGIPQSIPIDKLFFDEFNPRISLYRDSERMGSGEHVLTQAQIEYALKAQRSYLGLLSAIRESKGAMVPIWVYPIDDGHYVVIEGNTRLIIYKKLSDDPEIGGHFKKMNCIVLPAGLNDEEKDFVRLTSHLRGHTDWDRYEQAKYLYQLYYTYSYPIRDLSAKTKLNPKEIKEDIEAYKIMEEQFRPKYEEDPAFVHKFSYFKEYVKNQKLRGIMSNEGYDESDFCDWVGKEKFVRALDIRKLKDVLENEKSREKFLEKDYERALEVLQTVIPERSQKMYMVMEELCDRIDKIGYGEIREIRTKDAKKKVIQKLHAKISELLSDIEKDGL